MARGNPFLAAGGWYRQPKNVLAYFEKVTGRPASDDEKRVLAQEVRMINGGVRRLEELTFEHHHGVVEFFAKYGRLPSHYPRSNTTGENGQLVRAAMDRVAQHVDKYHADHPSFFSHLNPVKLISAAANVVSAALPFVKTALSLVPGVGTGINMALSAAEALAKGRPLTDAFVDGLKSAIPGGPIAQTAFNTAVGLAKGQRIDEAALNAAKAELPPVAQKAFDVGLAVAHGRNLQDVAIDQVKSLAADQIKGLKLPIPDGVKVPIHEIGGFKIGLGVLKNATLPGLPHVPLTPAAALEIRNRLTPAAQAGFDRAMGMRAMKHYRAGSPHVPKPQPSLRGATFVTRDGARRIGEAWAF